MIKTLLHEKGVFGFKDEITIPDDIAYTVVSIDTAKRLSAMGVELEKAFKSIGVSDDDIAACLSGDDTVYRLEGNGVAHYCPVNVIIRFPGKDTIAYQTYFIGVELGDLPNSVALDGVKAAIAEQVEASLGVKPTVASAARGRVKQVKLSEHRTRLNERVNNTHDSVSTYAKLKRVEAELEQAKQTIQALMKGYE